MSVAARPAENATMSASPRPSSCWAIAPSSTTRAEGHGMYPGPCSSSRRSPATARTVVVVMVMVVRVAPAPDVPPAEHGGSDGDDEDAGPRA